jgi:hypothetical protein
MRLGDTMAEFFNLVVEGEVKRNCTGPPPPVGPRTAISDRMRCVAPLPHLASSLSTGMRALKSIKGGLHVKFSSRFGEMVAEERRGPHFGLFDTRAAAREWLGRPAACP